MENGEREKEEGKRKARQGDEMKRLRFELFAQLGIVETEELLEEDIEIIVDAPH